MKTNGMQLRLDGGSLFAQAEADHHFWALTGEVPERAPAKKSVYVVKLSVAGAQKQYTVDAVDEDDALIEALKKAGVEVASIKRSRRYG